MLDIPMAIEIVLRNATPRDVDTLSALRLRASRNRGDSDAAIERALARDAITVAQIRFTTIAEIGTEVAGFSSIAPGDGRAELTDLFVSPALWRRGIGRLLLAAAEQRARVLGAHTVHLVANDRARPFYEAAGYHVVGQARTDLGFAPAMKKSLGPASALRLPLALTLPLPRP